MDVRRVFRRYAVRSPVTIRRRITFASQAACMAFHAGGVVCDLETGYFDVAGVRQVHDERRPPRSPQLRRMTAPGVPSGSQDAGRMLRIGTARDGRHITIEGGGFSAALCSGSAKADLVRAGCDDERITAGYPGRAARWQGLEGMIPGTGLTGAAARIRRVGKTAALFMAASVGADIVH